MRQTDSFGKIIHDLIKDHIIMETWNENLQENVHDSTSATGRLKLVHDKITRIC